MELEDRVTLVAPEGLTVDLVVAGLGSRAAAALIDMVISTLALVAVWLVSMVIATSSESLAAALMALGAFAWFFGYATAFEAFGGGRTPGKRMMGIRVLDLQGARASFWRIAVRNALRIIDYLPSSYLVGIVSVLVTERNQRLGDLVAGTIVVRERLGDRRPGTGVVGPSSSPALWAAPVAAPPPALAMQMASWDVSAVTPQDMVALQAFLERRWALPPHVRAGLATDLAGRLYTRVQGPPVHEGPERFLEWVVYARQNRGA